METAARWIGRYSSASAGYVATIFPVLDGLKGRWL